MEEREQIKQHIVQLNKTVRDWFEEENPDELKEFHLRRHLWYRHVIKTTEDYLREVEECNKRCEEKEKEIDKKKKTIEREAKKKEQEIQRKIDSCEERNSILNQIQAKVQSESYKLDQELAACKRACGRKLFEIEAKMLAVLFYYDTIYGVMLSSPFELEVNEGYFSRDRNFVTKEGWQYRPPEPQYIDGEAVYDDPEDDPYYDMWSEDPETDPYHLLLEMAPKYPDVMFHAENEESFKREAALFDLACKLRRELDVEKTSLSYAVSQQEKEGNYSESPYQQAFA